MRRRLTIFSLLASMLLTLLLWNLIPGQVLNPVTPALLQGRIWVYSLMQKFNGGAWFRGTPWYDVASYATAGAGTSASPWTGWEPAFDSIPSSGRRCVFGPGFYTHNAAVALPVGLTGPLVVSGYGAQIKLTSSAPRLFDINRTADYQSFQNITIEGLTVDADNLGGKHHVVLGTWVNGSTGTGIRLNISDVVIRDVTTLNVKAGSDVAVDLRMNVGLVVDHPASGETQTNVTHVLVDHCKFGGGLVGVNVNAILGGGGGPVNVFFDDVTVRNNWHDTTLTPGTNLAANNYYLIGRGFGRTIRVLNNVGLNAGDSGIEVDTASDAIVQGNYVRDSTLQSYYHTMFHDPPAGEGTHVVFRDNTSDRTFLSTSSSTGRGVSIANFGSFVGDDVVVSGYKCIRRAADFIVDGDAIYIASAAIKQLTFRDVDFNQESISQSTATINPRVIHVESMGGTQTYLVMDGVKITQAGDITGESAGGAPLFLLIGGSANQTRLSLNISNILVDSAVTGSTAGFFRGFEIGLSGSSRFIDGRISKVYFRSLATGGTNSVGLRVRTSVTMPTALDLVDIDFSGKSSGGNDLLLDSNSDKVHAYRCKWRTYPAVGGTITAGASPYAYQNLDQYPEYVTVGHGTGTVTAIDYSVDNSTYRSTGVVLGIFRVEPSDYLKVTYTGATGSIAMTKTPVR